MARTNHRAPSRSQGHWEMQPSRVPARKSKWLGDCPALHKCLPLQPHTHWLSHLPTTIYSPAEYCHLRVLWDRCGCSRAWKPLSSKSLLFLSPSLLSFAPCCPALCALFLCTRPFPTSERKNGSQTGGGSTVSSKDVFSWSRTRPQGETEEGGCSHAGEQREEPLTLASQVPTLV